MTLRSESETAHRFNLNQLIAYYAAKIQLEHRSIHVNRKVSEFTYKTKCIVIV